jgi:hypothetical protein
LGARRILADFLIGAHATARDYRLLTMDVHIYRAAFPTLKIETIENRNDGATGVLARPAGFVQPVWDARRSTTSPSPEPASRHPAVRCRRSSRRRRR